MSDELQRCLAFWIADYRQRHGMSQAELGEQLGVSAYRVSQLEHGTNVRLQTLERIAQGLEISPIDLVRPVPEPNNGAPPLPDVG